MRVLISLKQLRTDPREYIRLLNTGCEVEITEHRKTIARAILPKAASKPQKGDIKEILRMIEKLPPIHVLPPEQDTVLALKKAKYLYLKEKQGRTSKA